MTTFTSIGADQTYVVPETGNYAIKLYGSGSPIYIGNGGVTSGALFLEVGTVLTFRVGGPGQSAAAGSGLTGLGGWPDGGNSGVKNTAGARAAVGGGGSTSLLIGGALVAIAGGGSGLYGLGGGLSGGAGYSDGSEGGKQYAGGNGSSQVGTLASGADYFTAGGAGSYMQGGSGSDILRGGDVNSAGGGGGLYGGGGGYGSGNFNRAGGGGGSGWAGALISGTTVTGTGAGFSGGSGTITYIGPDPSGVMPGVPLVIRVRAETADCYVEKDITVRVLGYVVHATFAIPALVVGTPISYQLPITAGTGYAPIVWTHTGDLPTGLTLSAAGLLSGTPSAAATYKWSAKATDDSGTVASTDVTSVVAPS